MVYLRVNAKTIKDAYLILMIDLTLDALAGSAWFLSLDLNRRIPMKLC